MKRRLFVGIGLPKSTKQKLGKLLSGLGQDYPEIKWEVPEKLHLTLKFLGNTVVVPETILTSLRQKLADTSGFTLNFGEIAILVNQQSLVVLEAISEENLLSLYHKINNVLENLKFARDKRKFYPHVTLGRFTSQAGGWDLSHTNFKLPRVEVKAVTLWQSQSDKMGTTYVSLGEVVLREVLSS
ncbi:MAG: 2'-5' RNA ligase [Candidatus Gottesmanbacteria bacterium GW2011_GWB1_43_11]|uniref:RNA 2',3'-cyclic phosphodiesterase n=1 Tax=Candidatus Gottesmanbacteria bacterium GW2011_GWB1_43_11 TaxID=1618446 RepID=A0A0G1CQ51_9BACT|nr:MAG: 2'-5' RNA ligase [Candidatus Gottesmanbacteria bacterium GW2011_GWA2_42_16]KKS56031.1 MAG: 2'-5' RNA ligase [Candidatus Gottesmanbacteria bacterium GW2011_GWA1_42_26]KKS81583.1 MAG: 2'-5' RNA ligase [Candidatus Gottesmanbacteria bacterium GW2011_GWC1_43_10]KKS87659.1 MAG: 2'-5' RNA ligase [Candidatus Gottesmanbacteria bacterium GW2011_GWB1_43_11]HCM37168.1 RNA 2',3'-cyclic phosphodiesterase [Patescibacteria group bacterium]